MFYSVLQCVAVGGVQMTCELNVFMYVLQCGAVGTVSGVQTKCVLNVFARVLQCVALRCNRWRADDVKIECIRVCVAARCSVLQSVAVYCSVLQCVAVCCSVLQCVAVCCCRWSADEV